MTKYFSLMVSLCLFAGIVAVLGCGGSGDGSTDASTAESSVIPNMTSIEELKSRFNSEGGIRLILVLSPTCKTCLDGGKYVQTQILDKIPGEPVTVYAIWTATDRKDTPDNVDPSILSDSRVSHFWDVGGNIGTWFANQEMYINEKIEGPIAFNFFSLHDADAQWGEMGPKPLASFGGGGGNGTIMRWRGDINRDVNRLLNGEATGFRPMK